MHCCRKNAMPESMPELRVWAPEAEQVELLLEGKAQAMLQEAGAGGKLKKVPDTAGIIFFWWTVRVLFPIRAPHGSPKGWTAPQDVWTTHAMPGMIRTGSSRLYLLP